MQTNKKNKNTGSKTPNKSTTSYKIGEKIEKLGDKVSQKGFDKVGKVIHSLGDKIEHLRDKGPMKKSA